MEGKGHILTIVLAILLSLLVLGILITIHEWGHYTAGRLLGFGIREFAIGMGPKIFKKEKNGILYTIRALPIGGMCSFYGEDEEIQDQKSFNAFPVWKRAIVIAAGPLMNFVLAIVLAFIMLLSFGGTRTVELDIPMIVGFEDGAPSETAGISVGDYVAAVNGKGVKDANEMIQAIRDSERGTVTLTVLRPDDTTKYMINGESVNNADEVEEYARTHRSSAYIVSVSGGDTFDITIDGIYDEAAGYNRIGASISMYFTSFPVSYTVGEAFLGTFDYLGELFSEMFKFLGSLFTGGASINDMAGIVGIVDVVNDGVETIVSQQVSGGVIVLNIVRYIVALAIMLSANLGIVNLFPFPALDGGRLVFLAIEAVFRKRVPINTEAIINFIGLILLFGLICVVTVNDVLRAIGR